MTVGTAMALPQPAETALTAVLMLATAVWVGGLVTIFVVASVAHATLGTAERVAFFRGLGRAYGLAGGLALTIALASGTVLASAYRWDGQLTASAVVAAGLVAATVAGAAQARRMTRLRQDALRDPGSPQLAAKVRRGAGTPPSCAPRSPRSAWRCSPLAPSHRHRSHSVRLPSRAGVARPGAGRTALIVSGHSRGTVTAGRRYRDLRARQPEEGLAGLAGQVNSP